MNLPLEKPRPDIRHFLKVMKGDLIPEKPPVCEYLIDDALMKPVLEQLLGRKYIDKSEKTEYMGGQMDFSKDDISLIDAWLDNQIAFWYHMGYDYVRVEVSTLLPAVSLVTKDTAHGNEEHNRAWQGLDTGPIQTWEDFERYPWPVINDDLFYIHQYICEHLPDGLGFITCHAGGVYEHVSRLMGYTGMCMALYEQPDLVKAVTDKLGAIIHDYNAALLKMDNVSAIFQGDDFGYNNQTLISPDDIRKYFLPWHKKFARQAHAASRMYFLHSCGKVDAIMDDLISDVMIDGKHSFQDAIMPIEICKDYWGTRISWLGGIDIHKLCMLDQDTLRRYVREKIDLCAPDGKFAVGSGNSVTSYVPLENYLTMMDEAFR